MSRLHVTTKAHQWLSKIISPQDVCVDATAGNGNDTLYMAGLAKKVYAFDIQPEAIEKTKIRCADCPNVTLILDSHERIPDTVSDYQVLVFNLGYLPNTDSPVITSAQTTLNALDNCLPSLTKKGHLLITYYRRHPGGLEEYERVSAFLKTRSDLELLDDYTYDEDLAPVFQLFRKR